VSSVLSSHPRQVILHTLSQRGPLTLDELARAAERSPLALRYHLRVLHTEGLIESHPASPRARVGRPQRVYALTARAHTYLPQQSEWLAAQVLEEVARTYGVRELRAVLSRIGQRLAKTTPLPRGRTRLATRLSRAVDFLCARGYAARWEKKEGDWLVRVGHCPYQCLARQQRAVCQLDLALISTLLQVPLKMTHCLAQHDAECLFVVQGSW